MSKMRGLSAITVQIWCSQVFVTHRLTESQTHLGPPTDGHTRNIMPREPKVFGGGSIRRSSEITHDADDVDFSVDNVNHSTLTVSRASQTDGDDEP